jgi:hypothetical protein
MVRTAAAPGAAWWLGRLAPDSEGCVERVSEAAESEQSEEGEKHREEDSEDNSSSTWCGLVARSAFTQE